MGQRYPATVLTAANGRWRPHGRPSRIHDTFSPRCETEPDALLREPSDGD